MARSLTVYHLSFTTETVTPLETDEHCGAALRGNVYESVWRRFCTNKASPSCAACELHTACPVSALVAPLREENTWGRDVPRPYLMMPPLEGARRYETGERFRFGMTLFGSIIRLLPYIMIAVPGIEAAGVGKRIQELEGRRGRFEVCTVESHHLFTGERQLLYERGTVVAVQPALAITAEDVRARAEQFHPERLTVHFLTPTRIVDKEHLVRRPTFRPLVQRLLERLIALEEAYGEGVESSYARMSSEERRRLLARAEEVICCEDATYWDDLKSYSRRLGRKTPLGGFVGRVTFTGELTPFRELLAWGELIHVGKSCVKGNGWYQIEG